MIYNIVRGENPKEYDNMSVINLPSVDKDKISIDIIEQLLGSEKSIKFKKSILENNSNIKYLETYINHINAYENYITTSKPYAVIVDDKDNNINNIVLKEKFKFESDLRNIFTKS